MTDVRSAVTTTPRDSTQEQTEITRVQHTLDALHGYATPDPVEEAFRQQMLALINRKTFMQGHTQNLLIKLQTGIRVSNVEAVMSQLMALNRQSFSTEIGLSLVYFRTIRLRS